MQAVERAFRSLLYVVILASPPVALASGASALAVQQGTPEEKAQAPAPAESPAQKHSTPEDKQRLVAVAHKLEAAPLDETLGPERAWAVQWLVAAPDLHV